MWKWFGKKKQQPVQEPDFWLTYQSLVDRGIDRRQPVDEATFVVFDTETTGLDVQKDRILSIGAVRVHGWQIDLSDHFEVLVRQPDHSDGGRSVPIHGILPIERPHSLTEEEAVRAFIAYAGGDILVGQHVLFDIAMINGALQRMELGKLKNRYLDTGQLADRVQGRRHPGPKRTPGLDELCQTYGIPPFDRHTAAGDAFLTALLFMKLLAHLKRRQVRFLGDLLR